MDHTGLSMKGFAKRVFDESGDQFQLILQTAGGSAAVAFFIGTLANVLRGSMAPA